VFSLSLSLLSSCRLPLQPPCLLLTANEARRLFCVHYTSVPEVYDVRPAVLLYIHTTLTTDGHTEAACKNCSCDVRAIAHTTWASDVICDSGGMICRGNRRTERNTGFTVTPSTTNPNRRYPAPKQGLLSQEPASGHKI
jgi:hypothetical protein